MSHNTNVEHFPLNVCGSVIWSDAGASISILIDLSFVHKKTIDRLIQYDRWTVNC